MIGRSQNKLEVSMIINEVESPEARYVVACFSRLGAQILAETHLHSTAEAELQKVLSSYRHSRWEIMSVQEYNDRVEKLRATGSYK